jgi:tRNA (guanine37-N1)-methyltransferase
MRFDLITIFPEFFDGPLDYGIVRRAREARLIETHVHDLRAFTHDRHRTVDDRPFGGGEGMVMKPEPIFDAVEELKAQSVAAGIPAEATKVVLMSPAGQRLDHALASRYAQAVQHLIIICGHYEGVDQRVLDHLVDEELSIGDYVLTNGAIAAAVVVDAVVRLIPGVLGDDASAVDDSFASGLLEFPQYTRPVEYRGWKVPEVLLSGHHGEIAKWRKAKALEKTQRVRPDLLD